MKRFHAFIHQLLFCFLMLGFLCTFRLPVQAEEVNSKISENKVSKIGWILNYECLENENGTKADVVIENGQDFLLSDMLGVVIHTSDDIDTLYYASDFTGISYYSSNKKVATVSSLGRVKTKKTGSCTLTVKVNSKTATMKIKVVKKGSLGSTTAAAKKLEKAVSAINTAYGTTGFNEKNQYTIYNRYVTLGKKVISACKASISATGFGCTGGNLNGTNKLAWPWYYSMAKMPSKLSAYCNGHYLQLSAEDVLTITDGTITFRLSEPISPATVFAEKTHGSMTIMGKKVSASPITTCGFQIYNNTYGTGIYSPYNIASGHLCSGKSTFILKTSKTMSPNVYDLYTPNQIRFQIHKDGTGTCIYSKFYE